MGIKPAICALLAFAATPAFAQQQHTPIRPATDAEKQARAAVVLADYRFGDLLWENDRTAHRIYSRKLEAAEPPSTSGIDIWGKRFRYPYMDRQLRTGDQHGEHGEGLDFYNVGTGRGAGGLGIWHDNKLWVSRNYARHRILNAGPDVADFSVDYDAWPVDLDRKVWETRRFTLPAGTNFTRMVSTIGSNRKTAMTVAIGISKRTTNSFQLGTIAKDPSRARMAWWGPADPVKGAMAIAVMVDPKAFIGFAEDSENYLILVRVTPGRPFVYYTGGAWDRGPDFTTREAWEAHVQAQQPDFGMPR